VSATEEEMGSLWLINPVVVCIPFQNLNSPLHEKFEIKDPPKNTVEHFSQNQI